VWKDLCSKQSLCSLAWLTPECLTVVHQTSGRKEMRSGAIACAFDASGEQKSSVSSAAMQLGTAWQEITDSYGGEFDA
jgi:hypothetical protein